MPHLLTRFARGTLAYQEAYQQFAEALYRTNILSDPWLYGEERFLLEPILLSDSELHALYACLLYTSPSPRDS